jgi:hypothetical protein
VKDRSYQPGFTMTTLVHITLEKLSEDSSSPLGRPVKPDDDSI